MILVPYTIVCDETMAAVPDATFVPVHYEHGYRETLAWAWQQGEEFTLVEHDVAPTREQLSALDSCSESWCLYGYAPGFWQPVFGCVRFGTDLIAATAGVWDDDSWPWNELDQRFTPIAISAGFRPHWHFPHVRHVGTRGRREPTITESILACEAEAAILAGDRDRHEMALLELVGGHRELR